LTTRIFARSILAFAVTAGLGVTAPARVARADAPTAEQLEAAKKAFGEGKALHEAGKLPEAIDKFKESYKLSKNPLLLYNIGFTLDEAHQRETALFYYRKFLSDAPKEAPQRPTVTERVKVLEQEILDGTGDKPTPTPTGDKPTPTGDKPTGDKPTPTGDKPTGDKPTGDKPTGDGAVTTGDKPKPEGKPKKIVIKPAGTYHAEDFEHQVVEEAPPGKPLDLTASIPEDAGWTVTLMFRVAGDSKFTAKQMKARYKELVARIPQGKMTGTSIQYYVEVKDQAGAIVTRSGKPTSPNLVYLEPNATQRFYPDFTDEDGGTTVTSTEPVKHGGGDEDDPLHPKKPTKRVEPRHEIKDEPRPDEPLPPTGTGLLDPGSKNFRYAKWGTTGGAVAFLAVSTVFYLRAKNAADTLGQEALLSNKENACPGGSPCRTFDSVDADTQSIGQSAQTWSRISMGLGLITAGAAGYLWYREHEAKQHPGSAGASESTPLSSLVVAPAIGDGFAGAAAAFNF
jgi:hypothetical protein